MKPSPHHQLIPSPFSDRALISPHEIVGIINFQEFTMHIDIISWFLIHIQELPESQRADAVSSMVYEANARLRDPVYGSAGAICQLQKQVNELQAQLAKAQAEVVNMQCQQGNLMALICMEMAKSPQASSSPQYHHHQSMQLDNNFTNSSQQLAAFQTNNNLNFFDDSHPGSLWETILPFGLEKKIYVGGLEELIPLSQF